ELKKENNEVSENALNMLTEKEITIMELREQLDQLKQSNKTEMANLIGTINDLKNELKERDEYDDKVSLNSDDERAATEQLKDLQYNYEKLKVQLEDKENEWAYKSENMTKDHEMIEEAYRQTISDYEIELSKLK